MTTIRLDEATLAQFRAADGKVMLCDAAGNPVRLCDVRPFPPVDGEPRYTAAELEAIKSDARRFTTAEVVEKLRRKM